jgi:hypothetical protein
VVEELVGALGDVIRIRVVNVNVATQNACLARLAGLQQLKGLRARNASISE